MAPGGGYYIFLGWGDGVTVGQQLEHEWTDGGFENAGADTTVTASTTTVSHTFTNTSGSERVIREVKIGAPPSADYDKRAVLDLDDMANLCIVPNGASVVITVWWWNVDYRGLDDDKPTAWFCDATLDTTTFTNSAAIHYNGVEFPDATITGITENSWQFRCHTTSMALAQLVQRYAAPVQVSSSILGKRYVISSMRAGTLNILNLDTLVHAQHENCYIQGPVSVEPFRTESGHEEYFFSVTIVQSGYAE